MKYPHKILKDLKRSFTKHNNVVRHNHFSSKRKISMRLVKRHFRLIR